MVVQTLSRKLDSARLARELGNWRTSSASGPAYQGLADGLRMLGLAPLVSHGNFLCVPMPDAQALAARLEQEGVIVRPLGAFGDPDAIRITVGTAEHNAICLEALGRVLAPV